MKHLDIAIATIDHYNKMDFDTFLTLFKKYTGKEVSDEAVKRWKFCGLNNVDFYKMHEVFIESIIDD